MGRHATKTRLSIDRNGVPKNDPTRLAVLDAIPHPKIVWSNSPRIHIQRVLQHVGLAGCFERIIGLEDTNYRTKPRSDVFAFIQEMFAQHSPIIFCDNSLENIETANTHGWRTIWFCPESKKEESDNCRYFAVHTFGEIVKVLDDNKRGP